MRKIAVCDDNDEVAQQLAEIIDDYIEISGDDADWQQADIYTEPDKLIIQAENYDVIFLDIEMPKMDGIEAGRRIRQINPSVYIVIASGIRERFKETYAIEAFRFVTKPYERREIAEALKAVEEKEAGLRTIEAYRSRQRVNIRQKDITYIEAYAGALRIHTKNEEYRIENTMDVIEKILDKRLFFRINRTYIVNMKWINTYEKGELKIDNCRFCIARERRKAFESAWAEFEF